MAFAHTLEQIQNAKTITWKMIAYEHVTSKDGKRTWANTEVVEYAYRAPGLYREVRTDKKGQIESVEIADYIHGRKLKYSPKENKATLEDIFPCVNPSGPFAYYQEKLTSPNLQWVEKRKMATGVVNVFRSTFRDQGNERDWSIDFWIDAKTKQLVAAFQPGADIYDPEKDPSRKQMSEHDWSSMTMIGGGYQDICYDVAIDDSLFRFAPPEGL